jgi:hypothetical protein
VVPELPVVADAVLELPEEVEDDVPELFND